MQASLHALAICLWRPSRRLRQCWTCEIGAREQFADDMFRMGAAQATTLVAVHRRHTLASPSEAAA
jgi:hypothetical protein